ncbi:LysR substrate-binding domain-containing protein [Stutzerimonas degradans]|uniref:LysR substrate-binding domain-containing protein n=1 Tax=Stutzerimonas degradans TaxID=2968968 RepID=UPI0021555717|nr:LysR substrate-binding domain-containing protein [Stutzerimonas degradans]
MSRKAGAIQFEAAVRPLAQRIRVRMELSQHEAIKQAVRAGFGLGCLFRLSVAGELGRGELVALATDLPLNRTFSLVWHPDRYRSPLWQAFKVFLQEERLGGSRSATNAKFDVRNEG